jgi:hypothetical protein
MQFAAALLEYLVSGIVALLWLVPLLVRAFGVTPPQGEQLISLYLPFAYVLGIFLDATSSALLERFRDLRNSPVPYKRTAQILTHAPESVIRTLQAYTGRDRIARGVLLSAVIGLATYGFTLQGAARTAGLIGAAIVTAWSAWSWKRLDDLTRDFKDQVLIQLPSLPGTNESLPLTESRDSPAESAAPTARLRS